MHQYTLLRTGKKLGKIDFDNIEKFKYRALRTLRDTSLHAMLETLKEAGVHVQYGMKIASVAEGEDSIKAVFEDGTAVEGDMLLGCDGIHSAVRNKFVEPSRLPEYTGVASAYGLLDADADLRKAVSFDASSLYTGPLGAPLHIHECCKDALGNDCSHGHERCRKPGGLGALG